MDHADPSRRQYAPHAYSTQQQQQQQQQQDAVAPPASQYTTVDRFRQSTYLHESPSSTSTAVRGSGDVPSVYGFPQSAQYAPSASLQTSPIQYGQDISTPETQRQQSHQYPQYGSGVVYGMAQPPTAHSYEQQVPRYGSRTSTAPETLASQFGVPQTAQYYLAGQQSAAGAAAAAPELPSQHLPSQYSQHDAYPQAGPASAQGYSSGMMDGGQSSGYSGGSSYVQQPQYQAQQPPADQAFERYQTQIRGIFTLARDGTLRDIGTQLIDASNYLLGYAEHLGLTRDDENLHDDRVRLWDEFNRAWLVTLQRQHDMTYEMMQSNQPLRDPKSLLSAQALERLSHELVRLCDNVERHGLVDYQIGVAEEEIMDLLLRCLSLLDGGGGGEPSSSGAMRGR